MFNLIDQSNILKGLDDQSLQREVQQPSGAVPPYLVLSEISRRKDMRQRYGGELAQQAPKTTVMQDVLSAPAMPGMGAQPPAMPPAGLAAAAQMGGQPPGGPGFAGGGLVDAAAVDPTGYSALVKRYQGDLNSITSDRDRDAALALLAAGSGILSGGHSNFGQNLGVGVTAGLNAYQDALKTTDARETTAMRGLSDIAQAQHTEALQKLQMAQNAIPNSQRAFEYRQTLSPENQQAFDDLNSPNAVFKQAKIESDADQTAQIGDAIVSGTGNPLMPKVYHLGPSIQAYIAKTYPDYNLAQAQQIYSGTQRMLSTMNGPGQVRLKQAIDFTDQSIDKLAELADQWNGGQFPLLNKANLGLALQGAKGQEAQSLAARLEAQRKEVISELATVYKGGNSPTDEGLKLAETQFDSAWSKGTFEDAVKQAKQNIQYRKNSLDQLAGGVGANNPYAPDTTGAPVTSGDIAYTAPLVDAETQMLLDKYGTSP